MSDFMKGYFTGVAVLTGIELLLFLVKLANT